MNLNPVNAMKELQEHIETSIRISLNREAIDVALSRLLTLETNETKLEKYQLMLDQLRRM